MRVVVSMVALGFSLAACPSARPPEGPAGPAVAGSGATPTRPCLREPGACVERAIPACPSDVAPIRLGIALPAGIAIGARVAVEGILATPGVATTEKGCSAGSCCNSGSSELPLVADGEKGSLTLRVGGKPLACIADDSRTCCPWVTGPARVVATGTLSETAEGSAALDDVELCSR
jgi:hypothetical protein